MKEKLGSDIYESWLKKITFVDEFNNYLSMLKFILIVANKLKVNRDDKSLVNMPNYLALESLSTNLSKKNLIDRLMLNEERINSMIFTINQIIKLKNPIGKVLEKWKRPNGLIIKKCQHLLVL